MRRDFPDAGDPGLPAGLGPPLRANGSRECAPDDRLREAIHSAANEEWIASSLALLAMTATIFAHPATGRTASHFKQPAVQTQLRDLAARFARGLPGTSRPLISEGAGNAGRSMRPQPRMQNKTSTRA